MDGVMVRRSFSVSCMAAVEETCSAVMLLSEKCVNHFLDSAQWPGSRFAMVHGILQFSFQGNLRIPPSRIYFRGAGKGVSRKHFTLRSGVTCAMVPSLWAD